MNVTTQIPRTIGLFVLIIMAMSAARAADPPGDPEKLAREEAVQRLDVYMSALVTDLPPRVQRALDRIPDASRKLLAVKYYLQRSEQEIETKWAWPEKQAAWYRGSAEYRQAISELDKVRRTFEQMYPGYRLEARVEIRSLASQIGKWNTTRSIATGADEMFRMLLGVISDSTTSFASQPDDTSLERFKTFLLAFTPTQHPTVAVPGLSQHGQFRAFDFAIKHRGRMIAGTSSVRIPRDWDNTGWTERLREAICRASDHFTGPLDDPYEPWHYAYAPN